MLWRMFSILRNTPYSYILKFKRNKFNVDLGIMSLKFPAC
jgi:hypothetical protein